MIKNKSIINIIEGMFLVISGILIYTLDDGITTLTLLYILPIYLILISFSYLYLIRNNKAIDKTKQLISLISGTIFLSMAFYIVINTITTLDIFIILFSIVIIIKSVIEYILLSGKINLIKMILFFILGILILLKPNLFLEYITYILVLIIVMGIFKLVQGFSKK